MTEENFVDSVIEPGK